MKRVGTKNSRTPKKNALITTVRGHGPISEERIFQQNSSSELSRVSCSQLQLINANSGKRFSRIPGCDSSAFSESNSLFYSVGEKRLTTV